MEECSIEELIDKEYNLVIRGIDDYKNFYQIDKKNFDGIIVVSQRKTDDELYRIIIYQKLIFVFSIS